MFYVLETAQDGYEDRITLKGVAIESYGQQPTADDEVYSATDIDFVDDAILNAAPHNPIERQLLTGDVVGLALMSSAIIWTALGAIA